jgi:hypothetical protein
LVNPYTDTKLSETEWIREFDPDSTDNSDYVWHQDEKDRFIHVLEGLDWKFQFDEELPRSINNYNTIFIPKLVFHRLIPGKTKLILKIQEVS